MRLILFVLFLLNLIVLSFRGGAQNSCSYLVWADEFETAGAPDPGKWNFETGGGGWGNNELQYYTESRNNSYVSSGTLKIHAKKSNGTWTSARMVTSGKSSWKYGRFEIKARLPVGKGTWPALWMMPQQSAYGSWPKSGEIDIMEHVGYDPGRVHGSIHTEAYNHKINTQKSGNVMVSNFNTQFHVYTLDWTENTIKWFVDGNLYFSFNNENKTYKEWPFDQSFFLIFNIAIGGDWGGAQGIDPGLTEAIMEVDYVRVYSQTIPKPVISGSAFALPGQQITFSTTPLSLVNYKWTFPAGVEVVSGAGTSAVTVKWNDQPGQVTVEAYSMCDTIAGSPFQVGIQSKPSGEFWSIPLTDDKNNLLWIASSGTGNQITLRIENGELVVTYNIQNPGANPHILVNLPAATDLTSHKEMIVQLMTVTGPAPNNLRIDLLDVSGQNDLNDLFKIDNLADDVMFHTYKKTFAMNTSGGWQPSKISQVRIYFNYGILGRQGSGEFRMKDMKMHNITFTSASVIPDAERIRLYPNPFGDYFEIQSTRLFTTVIVYNLAGQVIFKNSGDMRLSDKIDMTSLQSGNYLISVSGDPDWIENALIIKK